MPPADTLTFAQQVQEWQVFYATLSGVTATLVGLLFVALYMNVDLFVKAEHQYLKRMSRSVFGSFTLVLFSSLIFLIPHQNQWGLGVPLLCGSVLAMGDGVLAYYELRRPLRGIPAAESRRIRQGLLRATIGRSAMAIGSILVFSDTPGLFYWLAIPMLTGLFAACRNCWDLLVGVRERLPH